MNGIMPGPLWLAIASATNGAPFENATLNDGPKGDTVTGMRADIDKESTNRRSGTGVDGSAEAAPRDSFEMPRCSSFADESGEESNRCSGMERWIREVKIEEGG